MSCDPQMLKIILLSSAPIYFFSFNQTKRAASMRVHEDALINVWRTFLRRENVQIAYMA